MNIYKDDTVILMLHVLGASLSHTCSNMVVIVWYKMYIAHTTHMNCILCCLYNEKINSKQSETQIPIVSEKTMTESPFKLF